MFTGFQCTIDVLVGVAEADMVALEVHRRLAGDVYVFAAEPTFRLLARSELGEGVRATAAVADGRLYIRGERHLYCIGKSR